MGKGRNPKTILTNGIKRSGTSFATLTLGLRPRQKLAKVWAKSEPRSHISCSRECRRV
jgi:hypothetical protein